MQINSISTLRENCIHICTEYMDGGSLDQYGAIPEVVLRPVAVSMIQGRFFCRPRCYHLAVVSL